MRAAVTACLLAAPPALHCQESQDGASATREVLAGAKEEFDAIQSARDAALMPKGGLPFFKGPELAAPAPTVSIGTKPRTPPSNAKSTTWLIDAMETQTNPRDGRGRVSPSRERRALFGLDEKSTAGEQEGEDTPEKADERNRGETTPRVENPLTRYLSDWMTPQDYALLKPGLSEAFDRGSDAGNFARFNVPGLGSAENGPGEMAFGGRSLSPEVFTPAVPRENPYLESAKPDALVSSLGAGLKPVSVQPVPPPVAPAAITPPLQTAPRTSVPDFAKPLTDEKYFRQLNRF